MSEDLISIIESNINKIHTSQYDLSFNELLDMYESDELNISPEFQRLFRWSEAKQSRFIESMVLEMPIPPIYVTETEERKYDLIDGLQRISTYLHFRGKLFNVDHLEIEAGDKLVLSNCDIIEELNGKTFDDLPSALKIRLKRCFIRMQVIRKDSNKMVRYHMFKRLNTGGEALEDQEVRNCTIRILDEQFPNFLQELTKDENFITTTNNISNNKINNAYREELILKFFAFKNDRDSYVHNISEFLDDYMEKVSLPETEKNSIDFDYMAESKIFKKVFEILALTMNDQAFSSHNKAKDKLLENFRSYHYEVFPQAILSILERIDPNNHEDIKKITDTITKIKLDPEFISMTTGGGKNTKNSLDQRINFAKDFLYKIEL